MSEYYEYGVERHDVYTSYGAVKVKDEAQMALFVKSHTPAEYIWWRPLGSNDHICGSNYHDFEAEEHERMVQSNIKAALLRRHRARDAYHTPSLKDLWPSGA